MDSRMCSPQKCTFCRTSGREELNRRHAKALSVSFECPRSPTWTSPQLTTSAFLESSSLCHVLCECHNNGRCRHERRHPFLVQRVQRICLHSDTHCQSHWKWSYNHTADSFSHAVTHALGDEIAEASFGRRAEPNTRIKSRYRYGPLSSMAACHGNTYKVNCWWALHIGGQ